MRRALALVALVALVGCGDGGDGEPAAGAAAARVPDVEGVLTDVDAEGIVVDGERYELSSDAASVSTYTLDSVPVRRNTFVHAGVDEDTGRVQWLATIGIVTDTDPPRVRYTGRLREVRDGRAVFEDGTALLLPPDLPIPDGHVAVEIDPATDRIVAVTAS